MNTESDFKTILSKSECNKILRKTFDEVNLIDYEILPAGSDVIGFLGEYYKLNIKYAQKSETKDVAFFIKSLPFSNELQSAMIRSLGFMTKEQALYSTLFEDVKEFAPRKWHPDFILGRDDILILEDVREEGYAHFNSNFNLPVNYVYSVLECLAAMHANSIIYETKTGVNLGSKYQNCLYEISLCKENTWIATGLKSILKLASVHPKFQSINYQRFITTEFRKKLERIYDLTGPSSRFQNALCHRDLWAKNLFYKKTENNQITCLFVDFQIMSYMPPAIDVLFFLYLNASKVNRQKNFEEYLNFYYGCLMKFTKAKDVDSEEFMTRVEFDAACNEYRLIPLVLCAIYAPSVFLPDGYFQTIQREDPERYHQLMQIDRDNLLVENLGKYEKYRIRTLDAIEELVDFVYEN